VIDGGWRCVFGPTADAGHKAMRFVFTLPEAFRSTSIELRASRASACRAIVEVDDPVVVPLGPFERQPGGLRGLGEEPRARPAGEGVDEEVEAVDQPVGEHRRTSVPLPET